MPSWLWVFAQEKAMLGLGLVAAVFGTVRSLASKLPVGKHIRLVVYYACSNSLHINEVEVKCQV
jgi:hypothetical protein